MANLSQYWANLSRDFTFRTLPTITKPATLGVVLTKNIPNATYTGQTTDELANANGYARKAYPPSDANWSVTGTSGQTYNNNTITFPAATADQGWASGVLITDSSTYGGGNVIAFGTLTNPRYISNTDQYTIPPSGLNVIWS